MAENGRFCTITFHSTYCNLGTNNLILYLQPWLSLYHEDALEKKTGSGNKTGGQKWDCEVRPKK